MTQEQADQLIAYMYSQDAQFNAVGQLATTQVNLLWVVVGLLCALFVLAAVRTLSLKQ